jgi:heptosyltransferase-2
LSEPTSKSTASPVKILVVGPSWVGDMVMAQSLFIALKHHNPGCQIDVLAPTWTRALLARMPEVSLALDMPPLKRGQLGLWQRIRFGLELRHHCYHRALVLPNSWKSALIPFFADVPVRTGYIGECRWGLLNDLRRLNKTILTQTVQRFVALANTQHADEAPNCPRPNLIVKQDERQTSLNKFGLNSQSPILALCPGAEYGMAKQWPASHYAQVALAKLYEGWQIWLFGSSNDSNVASQINQQTGFRCQDLTGKTSMTEAIDLMSWADLVVSNDSGLMHVAAALNKKLIAIYGSSDPEFTPPLSEKAKIVRLNLDCSPCFKRECPLDHLNCLTQISPKQILDELNNF